MDDLYDFLADPSDAAKGRRLAAALRGQRGQADLLQATGDKQLGGLAAQQYRQADEAEQAMRVAQGGYLTRAAEMAREQAKLKQAAALADAARPLKEKQADAALGRIEAENVRSQAMLAKALAASKKGKGGGVAAPAVGPDGKPAKKTMSRAELAQYKMEAALGPLEGWEPIDPTRPAFRDTSIADKAVLAQAADQQLDTHVKDALEGYDEYLKAPTGSDDWVNAKNKTTNALVNLTSKMLLAEGKPQTEGSEQAIAGTLGLRKDGEHGGWTFVGPESMWTKSALSQRVKNAAASGHANFNIFMSGTNQRRKAAQAMAKAAEVAPASAPAPVAAPLSDEDKAAIEWAKANPTNADAQTILKLHGL